MTIEINYSEGCQKCRMTNKILSSKGKNTLMKPFTSEKIDYAKSKGMKVAPLVQVFDDEGKLLDEWNDFNTKKINYWSK